MGASDPQGRARHHRWISALGPLSCAEGIVLPCERKPAHSSARPTTQRWAPWQTAGGAASLGNFAVSACPQPD